MNVWSHTRVDWGLQVEMHCRLNCLHGYWRMFANRNWLHIARCDASWSGASLSEFIMNLLEWSLSWAGTWHISLGFSHQSMCERNWEAQRKANCEGASSRGTPQSLVPTTQFQLLRKMHKFDLCPCFCSCQGISVTWVCIKCVQVSERDDRLLAETMQKLGDSNQDVDGDADSEEEEDQGMGTGDLDGAGLVEL